MKQKEIITLIIMPLISMFVALITSWFVTRMTINNQNDILERDYKLKIIDKRMNIIDEASNLIGAEANTIDVFNQYKRYYSSNNESGLMETSKVLGDYNSRWQSNIVLSSLYFGESTSLVIRKMSNESAPWWSKDRKLQDEYLVTMMNELYLGVNK